jgi:hypothetical protein
MQDLSTGRSPVVAIDFTPEQAEALEATRAKLNFTPSEFAALKERQRKSEALLLKMADSTPEESDRLAGQFFYELRAGRRISMARRAKTRRSAVWAPRRTTRSSARPRAQAARSSAKSGDSGDDDPAPLSRPEGRVAWAWSQTLRAGGRS